MLSFIFLQHSKGFGLLFFIIDQLGFKCLNYIGCSRLVLIKLYQTFILLFQFAITYSFHVKVTFEYWRHLFRRQSLFVLWVGFYFLRLDFLKRCTLLFVHQTSVNSFKMVGCTKRILENWLALQENLDHHLWSMFKFFFDLCLEKFAFVILDLQMMLQMNSCHLIIIKLHLICR